MYIPVDCPWQLNTVIYKTYWCPLKVIFPALLVTNCLRADKDANTFSHYFWLNLYISRLISTDTE